ncbi:MAG: YdcF family protein, partial [Terriglobia bacterium]
MLIRMAVVAVLVVAVILAVSAERSLYRSVRRAAQDDEARPAGAIVVLGAAEYNGDPSPIYKARLDHAFDLEEEGLAPLVITTGGSGGDAHFTEAGVGRDYLIQEGMAADKILAESYGSTTYDSVNAAARLLAHRHIGTCITVSDG